MCHPASAISILEDSMVYLNFFFLPEAPLTSALASFGVCLASIQLFPLFSETPRFPSLSQEPGKPPVYERRRHLWVFVVRCRLAYQNATKPLPGFRRAPQREQPGPLRSLVASVHSTNMAVCEHGVVCSLACSATERRVLHTITCLTRCSSTMPSVSSF